METPEVQGRAPEPRETYENPRRHKENFAPRGVGSDLQSHCPPFHEAAYLENPPFHEAEYLYELKTETSIKVQPQIRAEIIEGFFLSTDQA